MKIVVVAPYGYLCPNCSAAVIGLCLLWAGTTTHCCTINMSVSISGWIHPARGSALYTYGNSCQKRNKNALPTRYPTAQAHIVEVFGCSETDAVCYLGSIHSSRFILNIPTRIFVQCFLRSESDFPTTCFCKWELA